LRHHLATTSELLVGRLVRFVAGDTPLCVATLEDGSCWAIHDVCTHEKESLSRGELIGHQVECPGHLSLFDVRTGNVLGAPATEPVQAFALSVEGDDVYVEVPA
jgi:3-phenylpropionate/trans-cinnamate dioxygenase ferredoxin component